MLWYGPGHVPALGAVNRPVTSAGIAPTEGEMLNYPFKAIDGQPMREAVSKSNATNPPKLWSSTCGMRVGAMSSMRTRTTGPISSR